jgi:hypothetical protein
MDNQTFQHELPGFPNQGHKPTDWELPFELDYRLHRVRPEWPSPLNINHHHCLGEE